MTDDHSPSRRAFLGGAAAASLALAGCTGLRRRLDSMDEPAGPNNSSRKAGGWTFEDLSAWRAHDGTDLKADSSTKVQGSQSARIEGKGGSISRHFTRPLDLSGRDVTFAVRVEQPRPVDVEVFLQDMDGNATQLQQAIYPKHPGEWIRVSPSIDQAFADMGQIASVLITLSGDSDKRYWVDDMRFPEREGEGAKVLFTFDYITRDVYEKAFPVMEEFGLKGCVSVPTDRIGAEGRLTADELGELHDAGWEVASMSNDFTSLYDLPKESQRKRIERGISALNDLGFGEPSAFVYPKCELDTTTLELVREYHDLGFLSFRDSEEGLSQRTVPAPHFFNRSQPATVHATENQLKPVTAYGGIYAMYWWVLEDTKGKTSPAEFRGICEAVTEAEGVEVVLPSDLV